MNANIKTSTRGLEVVDTLMLDAPVASARRPVVASVRGRLGLAVVVCAAFFSCSPAVVGARGVESPGEAPSTSSSAEVPLEASPAEPSERTSDASSAPQPGRARVVAPDEPRSVHELLEEARRDVLGLGRADVSNIKERAAQVLSALAAVLHALDEDHDAAAQLAELDFEAERLRRASGASFAQSGWVRLGLLAALDALQHVAPAPGRMREPLRDAARQAAEAIPERSSLAFHHAAIQDAARATVDAYALSLPGANSCLDPDEGALESASQTERSAPVIEEGTDARP